MSGSTGGEKPLSGLAVVSNTSGLRVLGFTPAGSPRAIEPAAFAAAPTEGVGLSTAAPLAGVPVSGLPGVATSASRADHRHPLPTAADVGAALAIHGHAIGDVSGLQAALDAKASTTHTHSISGVNGLQTALDGKANVAHQHAIGDVTGLQTALDGKLGLAGRGAANGVAPLDGNLKVPLANLPASVTGQSNVVNGTVDGQLAYWNTANSRYEPASPLLDSQKRIKTLQRNSATVVSFVDYNNANIVLTGNAPLTVAATEAGQPGDQGMAFMVKNRHTAINTITFGAGLVVDAYPAGTGSGGSVKIDIKGSVTVHIYPGENSTVIAEVRGQIV